MSVLQERQARFYQLVDQGQLSHAYLLTGDDLANKQATTIGIIQALACQDKSDGVPCGVCEYCQRAMANELPDILYLQPDGRYIRVDQIRELKEWLSTSPLELNFKMAVIEVAELMNPSASNALLKFLEEPASGVYLMLYAQDVQNLLPTIQSRVQKIHFPGVTRQEVYENLLSRGIEPSHSRVISRLSTNSIEHLVADYDQDQFSQWLKNLNNFYGYLVERNYRGFTFVQTQLKNEITGKQGLDSLDYLLLLCHSSLMQLNGSSTQELLQGYFIQELHKALSPQSQQIIRLNHHILETKEYMMSNVSGQLAFERLALKVIVD